MSDQCKSRHQQNKDRCTVLAVSVDFSGDSDQSQEASRLEQSDKGRCLERSRLFASVFLFLFFNDYCMCQKKLNFPFGTQKLDQKVGRQSQTNFEISD